MNKKEHTMEIYHGSYTIIEHPKLMDGRFTKDFGNGFYCTSLRHQAERWAGRYDTPIIDIYEYEEKTSLNIKKFETMTDEWLDFVVDCRLGKPHDYDIVMGAMADDQIYNFVADFMNGNFTPKIRRQYFLCECRVKTAVFTPFSHFSYVFVGV